MLCSFLLSFRFKQTPTAKHWQTYYSFLQVYHSYYNKNLRLDKLASFTLALKSLVVFVYPFSRTWQTKLFDINSEYIKGIHKFRGEIYSENCQLSESFYRFQVTFMYLEKRNFFCQPTSPIAFIFHYKLQS